LNAICAPPVPCAWRRRRRLDAEVLARYSERGVPLIRTDHAGAAQWRFGPDGHAEFRSWRSLAARYGHNRPGAGQRTTAEAADESVEEGDTGQPFFGMP
jgi:hypothetical protein